MAKAKTSTTHIYNMDDIPLFVDIPFLHALFMVSCETLRRRCVEGRIRAVKIGDSWRVPKSEIERLYNEGGVI